MSVDEALSTLINYLKEHPNAGDTMEGITGWWITVNGSSLTREEISAAVDLLVQKRILKCTALSSGENFYRLIRDHEPGETTNFPK